MCSWCFRVCLEGISSRRERIIKKSIWLAVNKGQQFDGGAPATVRFDGGGSGGGGGGTEQLAQLTSLKDQGVLTDEEFNAAVAKLV
jgi:hypothetical protein